MSPEELAFFDASVRDLAANKITPFQWEDRVYTYFGLSKEECLQ
jgi:hypothetical protein